MVHDSMIGRTWLERDRLSMVPVRANGLAVLGELRRHGVSQVLNSTSETRDFLTVRRLGCGHDGQRRTTTVEALVFSVSAGGTAPFPLLIHHTTWRKPVIVAITAAVTTGGPCAVAPAAVLEAVSLFVTVVVVELDLFFLVTFRFGLPTAFSSSRNVLPELFFFGSPVNSRFTNNVCVSGPLG